MSDGLLYTETLAQVISLAEENKQQALKPEMSRQKGFHFDNNLTIQTKRGFKELQNKYQVMTHMWFLSQMRQPTRPVCSDLKENTFTKFLSEKNLLLEREVAGSKIIVPNWAHCLEYEFQLRKDALKLTREEGQSIEKAVCSAYNDPQHRIAIRELRTRRRLHLPRHRAQLISGSKGWRKICQPSKVTATLKVSIHEAKSSYRTSEPACLPSSTCIQRPERERRARQEHQGQRQGQQNRITDEDRSNFGECGIQQAVLPQDSKQEGHLL